MFDTFCLGLNAIIGSGIFIFPGLLAKEVGPASILAFGVCGVLLVFVALCYAELGSMFRQNGGCYVYAKEAFGPFIGFGIGWICWMTSVFSWAAVASAVSSNLAYFHPVFNQPCVVKAVAAALIGGFTIINYCGIKLGAWTVNFFTLAKVIPLLLFIAIGAFFVQPAQYHPFWNPPTGSFSFAVFLALWALQGFEVVGAALRRIRRTGASGAHCGGGLAVMRQPALCPHPGGRGGDLSGPGERGHQAPGRGGRPVYGTVRRRPHGSWRREFDGRVQRWKCLGGAAVSVRAGARPPPASRAFRGPSTLPDAKPRDPPDWGPHRLCRCVSQVPKLD